MKRNRWKGNLFAFLFKNYLVAFGVTIFFCFAVVFIVLEWNGSKFFSPTQGIHEQEDILQSEKFHKLHVEEIVGKNGGLEIINSYGEVVFTKGNIKNSELKLSEIRDVKSMYYDIRMSEYTDESGNKLHLIKTIFFREESKEWFMLLDENFKVINSSGNIKNKKKQYTQEEIELMIEDYNKIQEVYKKEFVSDKNRSFTMVLYPKGVNEYNPESYEIIMKLVPVVIILIVILCTGTFIVILSKRLRYPIKILNDAMLDYSKGNFQEVKLNKAPQEFVNISDTFNYMVTRIKKSEEKEKEYAKEKQKIIADISHDLKTPITIINGYAKAIVDGKVDLDDQDKYLNIILNKSSDLTKLINLFHEYSKMEHPDYKICAQKENFSELLRVYIAELYNYIYDLGFQLDIDIDDRDFEVEVDQVQFKRALWNIISNALKYNPKGSTILVKLYEEGSKLYLAVGDNGVGIKKEIRETIFNAFVVGDDSRSTIHGSGLGLAITKKIVEEHGWKIWLGSEKKYKGYKTIFVIEIDE